MLAFLKSEALHPADFTIREDGVVRLNPELPRTVARVAIHAGHLISDADSAFVSLAVSGTVTSSTGFIRAARLRPQELVLDNQVALSDM